MVEQTLIAATRSSRLALAQTEEALAALRTVLPPGLRLQTRPVTSPGDRDLQTPLTDASVPDDFFTRDLDDLLLSGRADLAVHSAKDLPKTLREGLEIAALLPARDIRDALVRRAGVPDSGLRVIGTSSPKREYEIRARWPNAECRPLRGAIDQRLARLDAGEFDAIIVAACALERLGWADRISTYLDYDPAPQQGRLAIVVRSDRSDLIAPLRRLDVRRRAGLVAIVGCPADPALLSVRAARYLDQADVVFHDRLIPDEILRRIAGRAVAVGKIGGHPSTPQSDIHRRMLHAAESGRLVARLHGGDPGIYGHLAEELDFLNAWNIRSDVVPAVTAMQVAAAEARAPLTHRGQGHRVTLVTARPSPGVEIRDLPSPKHGHLAIYMGVSEMEQVEAQLRAAGWPGDTSVIIAERLGYSDERILHTDLDHWRAEPIESPAVFLVGTRSHFRPQATLFVGTDPEHFIRHGPLIHFPLIELASRPLEERAARIRELLPAVRGVFFPSKFAVRSFIEALLVEHDTRALAGKTILAVGPSTEAELRTAGLRADGAADNLGGIRTLVTRLPPDIAGAYLYPCSDAAPQAERAAALAAHGIELRPAVFYENRETPLRALPRRPFARVLFTSTSAVRAYFNRYPDERRADRVWLAVGPSTRIAIESLGLNVETIEG